MAEMTLDPTRNTNTPDGRWTWKFYAVSLGTLSLEAGVSKFLYDQTITPPLAFLAHLVIVSLLGIFSLHVDRMGGDRRLSLLLLMTTFMLGPFGAAGTLATAGLLARYARSSTPFEEWYASLFPEEEGNVTLDLFAKIDSQPVDAAGGAGVVPFKDILTFGTHEEKLEVIIRIAKQFKPAFAPALRFALNDSSNAIRVQAATAIAKIENDFMKRAIELNKLAGERPNDPQLVLALARHYDDYAYTGLLDSVREHENRAKAMAAYKSYLQHTPKDPGARMAVGRILLREGRYLESAAWLEESIQQGFSTPQINLWYMESLSHLGRFQDLRRLARMHCAEWSARGEYPPEVLNTLRLWAGQGATAGGARVQVIS